MSTTAVSTPLPHWLSRETSTVIQHHREIGRGKVLALRGQPTEARRQLARAVALAEGSSVETEARWLLASVLEQLGKRDEAKRELAKLIATGLRDDFTKKATAKLKEK